MKNRCTAIVAALLGVILIVAVAVLVYRLYVFNNYENVTYRLPKEQISTLKRLILFHRHGDRTIISVAAEDPIGDPRYWPEGLGELTEKGKMRMLHVGNYLRQRYAEFLGHDTSVVMARSADYDRCIASCQLLLASMFPPDSSTDNWWDWLFPVSPAHKRLHELLTNWWQPVPITVRAVDRDELLEPRHWCNSPVISAEYAHIENSIDMIRLRESLSPVTKLLHHDYGYTFQNYHYLSYIADRFMIARSRGIPLPDWVTDNHLEVLNLATVKIMRSSLASPLLRKLFQGPMLEELLKRSKNVTIVNYEHIPRDKRVFVYSTHDVELIFLLEAFGLKQSVRPDFGTTVIFEIHERKANQTNRNQTMDHVQMPLELKATQLFWDLDNNMPQTHDLPLQACHPTYSRDDEGLYRCSTDELEQLCSAIRSLSDLTHQSVCT